MDRSWDLHTLLGNGLEKNIPSYRITDIDLYLRSFLGHAFRRQILLPQGRLRNRTSCPQGTPATLPDQVKEQDGVTLLALFQETDPTLLELVDPVRASISPASSEKRPGRCKSRSTQMPGQSPRYLLNADAAMTLPELVSLRCWTTSLKSPRDHEAAAAGQKIDYVCLFDVSQTREPRYTEYSVACSTRRGTKVRLV